MLRELTSQRRTEMASGSLPVYGEDRWGNLSQRARRSLQAERFSGRPASPVRKSAANSAGGMGFAIR